MSDAPLAEEIAIALGTRPFLLFGVLVIVGLASCWALVATLRWSERHARALWKGAMARWSGLATTPVMRRLEARFPLVWRLMRTLTATEYLILHVAIGFVVALSTIGFLAVADAVSEKETMVRVDLALAGALHASADPATLGFFRAFTFLGGGYGLTFIGFAVAFVLVRLRKRLLVIGWSIALLGVGLLNAALKAAFARPRPSFEGVGVVADGWSFPSGHSMGTWVTAGMLVYVILVVTNRRGSAFTLAGVAIVWSVAMGFSRMILGAHYLTDVIGGFAAGTVWLGACISGIEVARRRPIAAA